MKKFLTLLTVIIALGTYGPAWAGQVCNGSCNALNGYSCSSGYTCNRTTSQCCKSDGDDNCNCTSDKCGTMPAKEKPLEDSNGNKIGTCTRTGTPTCTPDSVLCSGTIEGGGEIIIKPSTTSWLMNYFSPIQSAYADDAPIVQYCKWAGYSYTCTCDNGNTYDSEKNNPCGCSTNAECGDDSNTAITAGKTTIGYNITQYKCNTGTGACSSVTTTICTTPGYYKNGNTCNHCSNGYITNGKIIVNGEEVMITSFNSKENGLVTIDKSTKTMYGNNGQSDCTISQRNINGDFGTFNYDCSWK